MAEGARLEIVCTQKVPGVRISPSPPDIYTVKSYVVCIGLFLLVLLGFGSGAAYGAVWWGMFTYDKNRGTKGV